MRSRGLVAREDVAGVGGCRASPVPRRPRATLRAADRHPTRKRPPGRYGQQTGAQGLPVDLALRCLGEQVGNLGLDVGDGFAEIGRRIPLGASSAEASQRLKLVAAEVPLGFIEQVD